MEPTVIVQKHPANESEMRPPMIGVKLDVPLVIVTVLVAITRGICISLVK